MTKYNSFFSVAVIFLALAFGSCQNQQVDGCTDPAALNYDPNATQEDGSCQFPTNNPNNEAGIVFWFTQGTANQYMNNDGIISIKFYVEGVLEGTHYLSYVDATGPACDAANHVTVKRTVPEGTVQYFPYVMVAQNGDSIAYGAFGFLGGSCGPIEVTY